VFKSNSLWDYDRYRLLKSTCIDLIALHGGKKLGHTNVVYLCVGGGGFECLSDRYNIYLNIYISGAGASAHNSSPC